ncbi:MAG: AsmA family protein [Methylovirgula sp.]
MRDILTILAIVLVIILSAALAVPYLVDWDAERSLVEAQLSHLLGQQVKIRGGIDLKLLPTPYLQLADLEVTDPAAESNIRADELHLEIALPPLLRGEVDFVEARLVRPQLRLRIEHDAMALPLPAHGVTEQMQFERISVEDGTVVIADPATGRNFTFAHIGLSAEARALTGPFTGGGTFDVAGEPTAFRFSTGERHADRLHFKLIVDESARYPGGDLDAQLHFAPHALPSIDGAIVLSGHQRDILALPWQLSGALHAELRRASITNLDLRLGDEGRAISLDGAAQFDFGSTPRVNLTLNAQQIDLDNLLTTKTGAPPMQRLANAFDRLVQSESFASLPFRLVASADSVLLGGETLRNVAASVAVSSKQSVALSFQADGPGLSHLSTHGTLEAGIAPQFTGQIDASVDDVRRLEEWLAANLPQSAPANSAPLVSSFAIHGKATISRVGFIGSDLSLRVNGSTLSGTLAYTKAIGPNAARFFADLSAPALELDSLPDLSGLARRTKTMDLALRLDAHAVRLSETQAGEINAGRIVLQFDRTGSDAKLENLTVNGIDGADLAASGQWDGHAGNVAVKLDAERLDGLVGLLRRFVPGSTLDFLADRAAVFSPAHLNLDAEVKMTGDTFDLKELSLAGTAGETTISGKADPDAQDPAAFNLSLRFDAKDSSDLLEQIGVPTLPLQDSGPGSIEIVAHGSRRLEMRVAALLAGTSFTFRGGVDPSLSAPHAAGTVTLDSADLSSLMRVAELGVPDLTTRLPAELSAAIDAGGNSIALGNLAGTFAGSKIAGRLVFRPDKGIDGAVTVDTMSLSDLLALALGQPQQAKPGALWSDANFAAPEIHPPPTRLAIHAANFALWPQITGHDAQFDLAISGTAAGLEFDIHHLAMQIGAGSAAADLTLRRAGANAAAEAHVQLRGCAVDLPSARGLLSGDLDLAGTGGSAAALVAGFAGSGEIGFRSFVLPDTDPGALGRVFEAVEEDRLGIDEAEIDRVLLAEFGKQPLSLGNVSFDAGLAAGVLRLSQKENGATIAPGITAAVAAALDLRDLSIDQESALSLVHLPKNWSGPPPQVTLSWEGSVSNPIETIDAATFVNALAARAIARESARIEAQEFDVHEHAFFMNRLESERRRETERLKIAENLRRAAEFEELDKAEAQRTEANAEAAKRKSEDTIRNAAQVPLQIGQPAPLPPRRSEMPAPSAGTTSFPDPTAAGRY